MHPIKIHAITGQGIFYSDSPGEKETLAEFSNILTSKPTIWAALPDCVAC
jgi:hypothetical protein